MPIEYKNSQAIFTETVSVDEAEGLLGWLQKKTSAKVNLSECTHLHPANLQVLMAARATASKWPKDLQLRNWLESAFKI